MPSPKVMPKKTPPRHARVQMRRRRRHHAALRVEPPVAEVALSTIAEESSQRHSTSSVSVDIEPAEVFIESPMLPPAPPPPYTGVTSPTVTVTSPACCVCHAARVRHTVPNSGIKLSHFIQCM